VPLSPHHERLNSFSPAGLFGLTTSSTSPNTISPPDHPSTIPSPLGPGRPKVPGFCLATRRPGNSDNAARFPFFVDSHLEDCDRPTAVLGFRHRGIDSGAGTSDRTGISPVLILYFCRSGYIDASLPSSKRSCTPIK
jgi:hypothetical protein